MKSELTFTVYGNPFNLQGNPLGYHRTTQGSFWNEGSSKYYMWKNYVIDALNIHLGNKITGRNAIKTIKKQKYTFIDYGKQFLLTTNKLEKTFMSMMIYYADYTHGDPSNVYKGIEDALFQQDKYLACKGFDFSYDKKCPRVEVTIYNPIYLLDK